MALRCRLGGSRYYVAATSLARRSTNSRRFSAAARAGITGGRARTMESRGTFGPAAQQSPRYMGIPTFMRSPLVSLDDACTSDIDVAMIGIPYDNGVTNRAGARHGPREVRVQSANMRGIHRVFQFSPFEIAQVVDVGDVAFEKHYGLCAVPLHHMA